jgi:hypothetical protein
LLAAFAAGFAATIAVVAVCSFLSSSPAFARNLQAPHTPLPMRNRPFAAFAAGFAAKSPSRLTPPFRKPDRYI